MLYSELFLMWAEHAQMRGELAAYAEWMQAYRRALLDEKRSSAVSRK